MKPGNPEAFVFSQNGQIISVCRGPGVNPGPKAGGRNVFNEVIFRNRFTFLIAVAKSALHPVLSSSNFSSTSGGGLAFPTRVTARFGDMNMKTQQKVPQLWTTGTGPPKKARTVNS
jgi:hypothetical protein